MPRYSDTRWYHATPSENVPRIRRLGLIPSRGAWGQTYETPRVYLTDDANACYPIAGQMICDHDVPEVSVLEVDLDRVPGAVLRDDPDWEGDGDAIDYERRVVYVEVPISAAAVGRVVAVYGREDFD